MTRRATWPRAARLTTGPSVEPVTLAEAKRHANVVASDDDTFLTALIVAARELTEVDAARAWLTQTWTLDADGWFGAPVELPRPPLLGVSGITYTDPSGQTQTLSNATYRVDTRRQPGRVIWGDATPPTRDTDYPVSITYTAGYGATAAAVPARAKQAILLLVGHWYRTREAVGTVGDEVALAYERLIRSLRLGRYP